MARELAHITSLRRKTIWDLYTSGYTRAEIAEKLDLQYQTVQSTIKSIVADADVSRHVEVEVARTLGQLDQMMKIAWPRALGIGGEKDGAEPDLEWFDRVLKVMERKAKLLGLDAAKTVDIHHIIEAWAIKNGFDPQDVIDVTPDLFPKAGAAS